MPDDIFDIIRDVLNRPKPDKAPDLKEAINRTLDAYKKLTPQENQQLKDWGKNTKDFVRGARNLLDGTTEQKPDVGPQYVFAHPRCIVTYVITQPNPHVLAEMRSLVIDTSLAQILNANPTVELAEYQIA